MNDTDPKTEALIKTLLQQKSGAERFLMGCSMYEAARAFALSSLNEKKPNLSRKQLKYELFLRFYKKDYTPKQLEKVKNHFK